MIPCYDGAEERRSNDPRVDGVTDQSKDDLERRTIEAVRLHRELFRNGEHHQIALSARVDQLGRIPWLPEDDAPSGGEVGRLGR